MEALADVASALERNMWGVKILPKPSDAKLHDRNPAQLDYSEFPKILTKTHTLQGFTTPNKSIQVTKVHHVPQEVLRLQRQGRILASGSAVVLNVVAAFGLIYGAFKLLVGSIFGRNDPQDAFKTLGKGFAVGGVAGAMTGIAQESPSWALGNVGMAIAGVAGLDKPHWLALHTLSDGLASIGMSAVRYREEANTIAVKRSIFNNPIMFPFRFLQPAEQAVYSFFSNLTSANGLKSFVRDEPYRMFRSAGGGLIAASGVLGLASLFKNKMSDAVNSFFFLPYSILSTVNLIAFLNDGKTELWRVNSFNADTKNQDMARRIEGQAKLHATPLLAVNNLFLALKGLGFETAGSIFYNTALAFRSLGAALAMVGFSAQSSLKFFKPSKFGPVLKEIWDVMVNPRKALENTFKLITQEVKKHFAQEDKYLTKLNMEYRQILLGDKTCGKVLEEIINTDLFKSLKDVTQIGLPTYSNSQAHRTLRLNRYDHCIGVGAISVIYFDEMLKNASSNEIRQNLLQYETAFKVACTIHDARHLGRSHVLEKAVEGWNNDEGLAEMLQDENAEISKIIIKHYGKETLKKILEIIGHKHPGLYKAFKDCDRSEYQGCSEYTMLKNPRLQYYKATFEDLKTFGRAMKMFKDKDGKFDLAYTPVGAVSKLQREFARYIYFSTEHGGFATVEADLPYCVGLAANANVNSQNVKTMSERELDEHAMKGIDNINGSLFPVSLEINAGADHYVGYSPTDRNTNIFVDHHGNTTEISEWIEGFVKQKNSSIYDKLMSLMKVLTTTKEVRVNALMSNKFGLEPGGYTPSSVLERQYRERSNPRTAQYAIPA